MTFSLEIFLIYAAGLSGLLMAWTLKDRKPPPEPKKPATKETRWRRFVVDATALREGADERPVVREDAEGIELHIFEGAGRDRRLVIGVEEKPPAISIGRPWFSLRERYTLRLADRPWFRFAPRAGGNFPRLEALPELPPGAYSLGNLSFQGSLGKREYEIRVGGRLAASITRRAAELEAPTPDGYFIEVVKNLPPLPFLALVVAFECSAARQGKPVPRKA